MITADELEDLICAMRDNYISSHSGQEPNVLLLSPYLWSLLRQSQYYHRFEDKYQGLVIAVTKQLIGPSSGDLATMGLYEGYIRLGHLQI